jgi:hypothetical protein
MKITIYDGKKKVGTFYIPDDASKEWVERNIPPLIRTAQLLAGKIEKTGF